MSLSLCLFSFLFYLLLHPRSFPFLLHSIYPSSLRLRCALSHSPYSACRTRLLLSRGNPPDTGQADGHVNTGPANRAPDDVIRVGSPHTEFRKEVAGVRVHLRTPEGDVPWTMAGTVRSMQRCAMQRPDCRRLSESCQKDYGTAAHRAERDSFSQPRHLQSV